LASKAIEFGENRYVKDWPRGQKFGLGLGLELLASASAFASASSFWPRLTSLGEKNAK